MKTKLTLALVFVGLTAVQAVPPANDTIAKASAFNGNHDFFAQADLTLATASPTDPLLLGAPAGKSRWFTFTVPVQPNLLAYLHLTIDSLGEIKAGLFKALDPDNPSGTLSLCEEAAIATGTSKSLSASQVKAGERYYLLLAGTGKATITHTYGMLPNDFVDDATNLVGDRGTVADSNLYATVSEDEPSLPAGIAGTNLMWYRWTPSFTDVAFVDTNFSFREGLTTTDPGDFQNTHHTLLAVYTRSPSGAFSSIGGDKAGGFAFNSRVKFNAVAGTTYYIALGTVAGELPGSFHLQYYRGDTRGEFYISDLGQIREDGGVHNVLVRRRYAANLPATCNCSTTSGGTATSNTDFLGAAAVMAFTGDGQDGQWEQTFAVTVYDDAMDEGFETIPVVLSNASAGSSLSSEKSTVVYLINHGSPDEFVSRAATNELRVSEASGTNQVTIYRQNDATTYETLSQVTVSGTAKEGYDFALYQSGFIEVSQLLGVCSFGVLDDHMFEADETFTVHVNGGCNYTVTIEDDDPYIPQVGKLTASLTYAAGARSAVLYATIAGNGTVTGKVSLVGQTLPFSGKLDWRGKLMVNLSPKGRAALVLSLAASDSAGGFDLALLDPSAQSQSTAAAVLQNHSPTLDPCPVAGQFTHTGGTFGTLTCVSIATIKVTPAGAATVAGRLFDGTAYTMAGYVDGAQVLNAAATLFAGQGGIALRTELPRLGGSSIGGNVQINRPARANDPVKLGVVAGSTGGLVIRYFPPLPGARVLDCWDTSLGVGKLELSGGSLAAAMTKSLAISTKNIVTVPADSAKVKLQLVAATGLFTGSFVPPGQVKPLSIYGVLVDLSGPNGFGNGFFFDGLKEGKVLIGKP